MPQDTRHAKPSAGLRTDVAQIQASNQTASSFLPGRRPLWMGDASTKNSTSKPALETNGGTRRPLPTSQAQPQRQPERQPKGQPQPQHVAPSKRDMTISSLLSTMPPPGDGSVEKIPKGDQQQQVHTLSDASTLLSPALTNEPSPVSTSPPTEDSDPSNMMSKAPEFPRLPQPRIATFESLDKDSGNVPYTHDRQRNNVGDPNTSRLDQPSSLASIPSQVVAPAPLATPDSVPSNDLRHNISSSKRPASVLGSGQSEFSHTADDSYQDGRQAQKRRRRHASSHTITSKDANSAASTQSKWLSTLDNCIAQYQDLGTLEDSVTRPRFRLLRDACLRGDFFYIALHRYFCLWSLRRESAHDSFSIASQKIDTTFNFLLQILRRNDQMLPEHLSWFASFPENYLADLTSFNEGSRTMNAVRSFLEHFPGHWGLLPDMITKRNYPLTGCEAIHVLACPSPGLQEVLFTMSRRRIGISDEHDRELRTMFHQQIYTEAQLMARGVDSKELKRMRQEMVTHYKTLARRCPRQHLQRLHDDRAPKSSAAHNAQEQSTSLEHTTTRVTSLPPPVMPSQLLNGQIAAPQGRQQSQSRATYDGAISQHPGASITYIQNANGVPIAVPTVPGNPITWQGIMGQGVRQANPPMRLQTQNLYQMNHSQDRSSYGTSQPNVVTHGQMVPPGEVVITPTQAWPSTLAAQPTTTLFNHHENAPHHQNLAYSQLGMYPQAQPHQQQHLQQQQCLQPQQHQHLLHQYLQHQMHMQSRPDLQERPHGYLPRPFPNPAPLLAAPTRQLIGAGSQSVDTMAAQPSMTSQRSALVNSSPTVYAQNAMDAAANSRPLQNRTGGQRSQGHDRVDGGTVRRIRVPSTNPVIARIPENQYPRNPFDWTSLRPGLHLLKLRSPERIPPNADEIRYYQYVAALPAGPIAMPPTMGLRTLKFTVRGDEMCDISRTRFANGGATSRFHNGSRRYRLRLCLASSMCTKITQSEWVTRPSYWPESIHIVINGQAVLPRRKQHFQRDLPIELTDYVQAGENTVKISLPEIKENLRKDTTYFMAIELVGILSHEKIWSKICDSNHIAESVTKEVLKTRFKPSNSDDIVVVENNDLRISLADPFSSTMFTVPVRGVNCKHLECFDLMNWLQTRPGKSSTKHQEPSLVDVWRCPICDKDARPASLRIDDYFVEVRRKLLEEGNARAKEITVTEDGSWTAVEEPDDDDETPPPAPTPIAVSDDQMAHKAKAVEIIEILDD